MENKKNSTIFFRLLYLVLFIVFLIFLFKGIPGFTSSENKNQENEKVERKVNQFGFMDDSLSVRSSIVKKNETLSDILEPYHLSNTSPSEIAINSKEIFDVRKIRAGKIFHIYFMDDSLKTIQYFVYEKNPVNYVVFDLRDSVKVFEGEKDVILRDVKKSAVIESSLYNALIAKNISIELAIKLSKIFAWQIDFYHLQKGDYFKVDYQKEFVDSQFVGIGKVLAAYFFHHGKEYYAIPFVQESVEEYFDEHGNSLRKAFLKTPIEFARISSRFSSHRFHPVLKKYRPHYGVDYAAPTGTPIRTVGDGIVVAKGYGRGNGNYVKIRHNSVYTTQYLHMSRFGKGIKKGTKVKQGQIIGYVGSTGLATGPHLDFRFYVNGTPVDPLKVEIPPSHPVADSLRAKFEVQKDSVLKILDEIPDPKNLNGKPPA